MRTAYEYAYETSGGKFTIPIPRGIQRKGQEMMKSLFREQVDGYLKALRMGLPELAARGILPSISKKFPRKGPRKSGA